MDESSYSPNILIERLSDGVRRTGRPVVFLAGSAFSAPYPPGSPGVPTALDVVGLVRAEFQGPQLCEFDAQVAKAENKYQEAFHFLHGRRGPEIANSIIKQAVWRARKIPIGG